MTWITTWITTWSARPVVLLTFAASLPPLTVTGAVMCTFVITADTSGTTDQVYYWATPSGCGRAGFPFATRISLHVGRGCV